MCCCLKADIVLSVKADLCVLSVKADLCMLSVKANFCVLLSEG